MSTNYTKPEESKFRSEDPQLEELINSFGHVGILEQRLAAFVNMTPQDLRDKLTMTGSVLSVVIQIFRDDENPRLMRYRHIYSLGAVERYRGAYGPPRDDPKRDDDFGGLDQYGSFNLFGNVK